MDQNFYELEVESTKNHGNMTSALLMLASSMDTLTRYIFILPSPFLLPMAFKALDFSVELQCG